MNVVKYAYSHWILQCGIDAVNRVHLKTILDKLQGFGIIHIKPIDYCHIKYTCLLPFFAIILETPQLLD